MWLLLVRAPHIEWRGPRQTVNTFFSVFTVIGSCILFQWENWGNKKRTSTNHPPICSCAHIFNLPFHHCGCTPHVPRKSWFLHLGKTSWNSCLYSLFPITVLPFSLEPTFSQAFSTTLLKLFLSGSLLTSTLLNPMVTSPSFSYLLAFATVDLPILETLFNLASRSTTLSFSYLSFYHLLSVL